jgi:DNA-binding response OmpR family regulator
MQTPMSIEDILAQVRQYSLEEEARLVEELMADLRQRIVNTSQPHYSILDFEGVARGLWDEVGGVDEFLKQERSSWDG